jgi:hypothetical protein
VYAAKHKPHIKLRKKPAKSGLNISSIAPIYLSMKIKEHQGFILNDQRIGALKYVNLCGI